MTLRDEVLKQRAEAVLGIKNEADKEKIRTAYYQKAKKHHPDLNPNDPAANDTFALMTEAFELLIRKQKGKSTLLEQDRLVKSILGYLPSSKLYNLTPHDEEMVKQGFYNFVIPEPTKQKLKDERRIKICS